MLRTIALLAVLHAAAAPPSVARHHDTDSYAHLSLDASGAELRLELDTDSLMAEVEALPPLTEDWEAADVTAVLPRIAEFVADHWQLELDGAPVALAEHGFELLRTFDPMQRAERNVRVVLRLTFTPPPRSAAATLRQTLFAGRELDHRHTLLLAVGDDEPIEWRVRNGTPFHFTLPDVAPGAHRRALRDALHGGLWHATRQPWLAAFMLVLLLAPLPRRERARSMVAAAAAAALTWSATRLGWIAPSPWAATAAAALAIAYVAGENCFVRELKLRTATAALFGVVEGMALEAPSRSPATATFATGAAWCLGALLAASAIGAMATLLLQPLCRRFPWLRPITAGALVTLGAIGLFLAVRGRPGA